MVITCGMKKIMKNNTNLKIFVGVVVVVVLAFVVASFFLIGSPNQQRMERLDDIRERNLWSIQNGIDSYWRENQKLPANLSELEKDIYLKEDLTDPVTDLPYEYRKVNELSFELCANFETDQLMEDIRNYHPKLDNYIKGEGNYSIHPIGRTCYTRTIDRAEYERRTKDIRPLPAEMLPQIVN